MKLQVLIGSALVVVSAATFAGRAGAADEKKPTIKQIMVKLHKGAKSPLAKVKSELNSESPNWEAVEKQSKDFVILGASLAKNEPKKGNKESWKQLADQYYDDAKALDDAAEAKDKAAASAAFQRLGASCKACHQKHK